MSDEPRELSGKALGYWAGRLGIDRATDALLALARGER